MHYRKLFSMAVLSFISMFILMYIMVNTFSNVYSNINQFYMAGLMTMPMIIIELVLMKDMYPNKALNKALLTISTLIFILLIIAIRRQLAVNDKQFLKSMIPHHASALLMCKHAQLTDPELKKLCENIQTSQQAEIDFMTAKLKHLSSLTQE